MTALSKLTTLFQKLLLLLLLSPSSIFATENLELAQIVDGAHVSSKWGMFMFDGVRGVQALQAVEPDELLVQLPFSSIIMARPWSLTSRPAGLSREYWAASSISVRTIAMAAIEIHRGNSSKFAAYFAHVPSKFDSLGHWSDEELQRLQDPDLAAQAKVKRHLPEQEYDRFKASHPSSTISLADWERATELEISRAFTISINPGPGVLEVMTLLVVGISLAIWLWKRHPTASEWLLAGTLGTAAVSRALVVVFALYDVKAIAMLPVIDDMNHAMVPDVQSRLGVKSSWQMLWEHGRWEPALVLKAGAAGIQAGQEIVTTYGNHSNAFFLLNYGFVIPDNVYQPYLLSRFQELLVAVNGLLPAQVQALQGRPDWARLEQVPVFQHGFLQEDLVALQSVLASIGQGGLDYKGDANAQLTQVLQSILKMEKLSWLSSWEQDRASAVEPCSVRKALALAYRLHRKHILISFEDSAAYVSTELPANVREGVPQWER